MLYNQDDHEWKLDAVLRRLIYEATALFMAGYVVIGVLRAHFDEVPVATAELARFASFPLIVGLLCGGFAEHWRMRVDRHGIHRRRFIWWCSYTWSEFASRNVRRGRGRYTFVFTQRFFWQTDLSFTYLPEQAAEYLLGRVSGHWVAPERTPPPDEIVIKRRQGLRYKVVRCTRDGIQARWRGMEHFYAWRNVERLVFFRPSHQHGNFVKLRLELPGETLGLGFRGQEKDWFGPKSEIISAFLLRYVPREGVIECARSGRPTTVAEADERLSEIGQWRRRFYMGMFALLLVPALIILMIWSRNPGKLWDPFFLAFPIGFLVWSLVFGFVSFLYRARNDDRSKERLEGWRSELEKAQRHGPPREKRGIQP